MNKDFDSIHLMVEIHVLKAQVKHLQQIIKFHKLDRVPLKYRKMDSGHNESEFFELDGFKEWMPTAHKLMFCEDHVEEVILPKDLSELQKSKEKMRRYAEECKKNTPWDSQMEEQKKLLDELDSELERKRASILCSLEESQAASSKPDDTQ